VAIAPTSILVLTRESINNTTNFHPFIASRLFLNLATDVSKRWVRFIVKLRKETKKIEREEEEAKDAER